MSLYLLGYFQKTHLRRVIFKRESRLQSVNFSYYIILYYVNFKIFKFQGTAGNPVGSHGRAAAALGAGGGGLHGEESGEAEYLEDAGPYVPVQRCVL